MGWLRMKSYTFSGTFWRALISATVVVAAFQTSVGSIFSEFQDSVYENSNVGLEFEDQLNDQNSGVDDEPIKGKCHKKTSNSLRKLFFEKKTLNK